VRKDGLGRAPWIAAALALAALAARPAVAAESVEACLASKVPTNQLNCLSRAALAADDPTLCLAAEDAGARWMCVATYAQAAGDAARCRVLPEAEAAGPQGVSRDLCRVHLAIAWQRPELCAGLATPNLGDACYLQMVEAGADRALCARIENAIIKSACGRE
jgi:hypothetical protein